jgi:hypothetical protein
VLLVLIELDLRRDRGFAVPEPPRLAKRGRARLLQHADPIGRPRRPTAAGDLVRRPGARARPRGRARARPPRWSLATWRGELGRRGTLVPPQRSAAAAVAGDPGARAWRRRNCQRPGVRARRDRRRASSARSPACASSATAPARSSAVSAARVGASEYPYPGVPCSATARRPRVGTHQVVRSSLWPSRVRLASGGGVQRAANAQLTASLFCDLIICHDNRQGEH